MTTRIIIFLHLYVCPSAVLINLLKNVQALSGITLGCDLHPIFIIAAKLYMRLRGLFKSVQHDLISSYIEVAMAKVKNYMFMSIIINSCKKFFFLSQIDLFLSRNMMVLFCLFYIRLIRGQPVSDEVASALDQLGIVDLVADAQINCLSFTLFGIVIIFRIIINCTNICNFNILVIISVLLINIQILR